MTVNDAIKKLTELRDKYSMGNSELIVETNDEFQIPIEGIYINTYSSPNEEYDYPIILISKEELP